MKREKKNVCHVFYAASEQKQRTPFHYFDCRNWPRENKPNIKDRRRRRKNSVLKFTIIVKFYGWFSVRCSCTMYKSKVFSALQQMIVFLCVFFWDGFISRTILMTISNLLHSALRCSVCLHSVFFFYCLKTGMGWDGLKWGYI